MSTWSLDFQPFCSTWTLLIGAFLAALLLFVFFRRERSWPLGILRASTLLLILLMAAQVTLVQTTLPETDIWILLDDSDSMKLPSSDSWTDGAPSRLEWAQKLEQEALPQLQANQTVHSAKLSELTTTRDRSPLGNALEQLSQKAFETTGHYPAAIVLLSDGVSTEGLTLAEMGLLAKKQATRVFPVAMGKTKPLPEIRIDALAVSQAVRATLTSGESLTLPVPLAFRRQEKAEARVQLRMDGEVLAEATRELSAASGDLEWHTAEPVTLTWTPPKPGTYRLELEARVETTATEAPLAQTFLKDRLPLEIHVTERTRRVFLASATPSWEFRYLQNLLKREPSIDLETWLADASANWSAQDTAARDAFPSAEDLKAFDTVILFANLPAEKLGTAAQNAVFDFARQTGKALVCIADPKQRLETWRGTPLEKCLPFALVGLETRSTNDAGGTAVVPTALGLTTSGFSWSPTSAESLQVWQSLPPQYRFLQIPQVSPGTQVLAEFAANAPQTKTKSTAASPAILRTPLEGGKVQFHAFDGTWRWRWRNDETYFRHYWVQTLHELCQPSSTEESAKPQNEPASPETAPARPTSSEAPLSRQSVEFQRTDADHDALAQLAAHSGGRLYTPQTAKTLASDIALAMQTRATLADQQLEAQHRRYVLWRHPLTFAALFLLLMGTWILARRRL